MSESAPPVGTTVTDPGTGSMYTKTADVPPAPAAVTPPAQAPAPAQAPVIDPNLPKAPAPLTGEDPNAPKPVEPPKVPEPPKPGEEKPIDPASYKVEGLPEEIKADDPLIKSFLEGAADARMSQEGVTALLQKIAPQVAEQLRAPYKAFADLQTAWQNEVKTDNEIGGDKWAKTHATLRSGITTFSGSPEAAQAVDAALAQTGAGNNPAIVKLLNNLFTRLLESTPVVGSPAEQRRSTAASTMYDHPSSTSSTG